jgi:hypothetical protein
MEQRRLRLGDILDDYCPRERRVTNHAIVAMVEDDIKQTRCTTCDAEHPYKGGKAPRRRKKDTQGALYKEVLAGLTDADAAAQLAPVDREVEPEPEAFEHDDEPAVEVQPELSRGAYDEPQAEPEADAAAPGPDVPPIEEGPVHRRLIRATLPRPEGQKEARPLPEFTIRQPPAGRANGHGHFRGDARAKGRGGAPGGNRPHGGPRFAGARPGHGQGHGHGRGGQRGPGGGFRPHQQRQGGGKKRSR